MNNNQYTSLVFSKRLKEAGCELESNFHYERTLDNFWGYEITQKKNGRFLICEEIEEMYPAYDILWDICVKYATDFFHTYKEEDWKLITFLVHTKHIFYLINTGQSNKIVEEYIWKHCKWYDGKPLDTKG